MVASRRVDERELVLALVLIPFIAGQWSLPLVPNRIVDLLPRVLIPFIAGQWSLHDPELHGVRLSLAS